MYDTDIANMPTLIFVGCFSTMPVIGQNKRANPFTEWKKQTRKEKRKKEGTTAIAHAMYHR